MLNQPIENMAIRKEKDGTYTIDVSMGYRNGKRLRIRKKGIKKLKEAQEIETDIRNERTGYIKRKRMTFKEAYLQYKSNCEIEQEKGNYRATTIDSKNSIFENHILPFFSNFYLDEITKDIILKFQKLITEKTNIRCKSQKLSNGTTRKIYKQLHAFFEYCSNEDIIINSPCKGINNFKVEKKEKEFLTYDEFLCLLSNVDNIRDKTILILLFFTGLRISELLGLTLDNIKLDEKDSFLKITQTCHKGEIRPYTKTDESRDIVYLDEQTRESLINYINSDYYKNYNSNYLFPSLDSKCGVLSEKAINNMIKKYSQESGISKNIGCHTFRHSHVAFLISMGVNLEDIKYRVRHSSIKTTSDEYGHMYDSRKKEVANNITKYIEKCPN